MVAWQLALNGLVAGAVIALVAVGVGLTYVTARFLNFAHAVVFTSCPYFVLLLAGTGLPLEAVMPTAVLLSTMLGCAMELAVYQPLRRQGSSAMVLMLASLGIYIVLQNVISLIFGDDTKTLRTGEVQEGLLVLGARITPVQIATICVSAVLVIWVALMLRYTKLGKAMRAVAADPELAWMTGIDRDWVILWAFAIGSMLSGVAGILVMLDVDMTPTMGMNVLMMAVVAVIVGGVGSIPGIVMGALLIGFAQNFGAWWLSSQWQEAIVFAILLIVLLFLPQGFLGKKIKKAVV